MQKSLVPSISIHNGVSMTQCSIPTVRRLMSSLSCHARDDLRLHHSGFTTMLLKSSSIGLIPCPHRRGVNIAYIYCGPLQIISWAGNVVWNRHRSVCAAHSLDLESLDSRKLVPI